MLDSPVELLDGVCEVVEELAATYPLILLTKGDLLHQQTKLARSGLGHHFKGIEIVSEKDARVYRQVMTRYAVHPERFVMVGNSLRSDILPVIEAGGHAVYVPYETTWAHEHVPSKSSSGWSFTKSRTSARSRPCFRAFRDALAGAATTLDVRCRPLGELVNKSLCVASAFRRKAAAVEYPVSGTTSRASRSSRRKTRGFTGRS